MSRGWAEESGTWLKKRWRLNTGRSGGGTSWGEEEKCPLLSTTQDYKTFRSLLLGVGTEWKKVFFFFLNPQRGREKTEAVFVTLSVPVAFSCKTRFLLSSSHSGGGKRVRGGGEEEGRRKEKVSRIKGREWESHESSCHLLFGFKQDYTEPHAIWRMTSRRNIAKVLFRFAFFFFFFVEYSQWFISIFRSSPVD